jgi:hypothetical protein
MRLLTAHYRSAGGADEYLRALAFIWSGSGADGTWFAHAGLARAPDASS